MLNVPFFVAPDATLKFPPLPPLIPYSPKRVFGWSKTMAMPQYEPAQSEAAEHQVQMMLAFNVYRSVTLLDVLDRPKVHAFVNGLAVSGEVQVVCADEGGVVVEVEPAQLAALERSGIALVESPLHGATYRAHVDGVKRGRRYASLSGFEAFDAYSERRGLSRVVPVYPVLAHVSEGDYMTSGRVVDLSPGALAADFDRAAVSRLLACASVRLDVWGDSGDTEGFPDFMTSARFTRRTNRMHEGEAVCRAVLEFEAYPALERTLRQYVARRQRELLIELGGAQGADLSVM